MTYSVIKCIGFAAFMWTAPGAINFEHGNQQWLFQRADSFNSTDPVAYAPGIALIDKQSHDYRVGLAAVRDTGEADGHFVDAVHGRVQCFGECFSEEYNGWNAGVFEVHNLRANDRNANTDQRIALMRVRGCNSSPNSGGMFDFFTRPDTTGPWTIGLHLSAYGQLAVGAAHGYPHPDEPRAWLSLAAGHADLGFAPLVFRDSGSDNFHGSYSAAFQTSPLAGAMEYAEGQLKFTEGDGQRRCVVQAGPVANGQIVLRIGGRNFMINAIEVP